MTRRTWIIGLWVVATMVATGVALAAVGSVAGGVTDSPASPQFDAAASSTLGAGTPSSDADGALPQGTKATSSTTAPGGSTSTSGAPDGSSTTSTSNAPGGSSTSTSTTDAPGSSTSTSTTDAPGSSTSTSTSDAPDDDDSSTSTSTTDAPDDDDDDDSSTTTTATPVDMETATYQLIGGWVRITYGGGIVDLDAAAPNAGFTMDIEDSGPDRVRVEFRNDDHRSEIDIEWDGGSLDIETEEEDT